MNKLRLKAFKLFFLPIFLWLALSSFIAAFGTNTNNTSCFFNVVKQKQDSKELISLLELVSIEEDTEDESKHELNEAAELSFVYIFCINHFFSTESKNNYTHDNRNTLFKGISVFLQLNNIRI